MRAHARRPRRLAAPFAGRPDAGSPAVPGTLLLLAAMVLPARPAPAVSVAELEAGRPPDERVVYRRVAGETLRLHVFRPRRGGDAAAPAVLLFHGGGWRQGAPSLLFPHARYLARRGVVASCAQYRLAETDGAPSLLDGLDDARAALAHLRAHAEKLGIAPGKLVVLGDSAGGHLAACLGTGALPGRGERPEPPAGMILYNPIVDMTSEWGGRAPGDPRRVSPLHHVDGATPPTLLVHGRRDGVVGIEQARAFARRLREAGGRARLAELPAAGHAFAIPGYGEAAEVARALREADRFLRSLGLVSGEPTIEAASSDGT